MASWWASLLATIGTAEGAGGAGEGHGCVQQQQEVGSMFNTWIADLKTVQQAVDNGYPPYDVFFSHSGELKHVLVAGLKKEFPAHVRTFADAWDLLPGGDSETDMVQACGTASIGVAVISPASVAKKWPMRELHILVDRHKRGDVGLVALLWFDAFEEFEAVIARYKQCGDYRRLWAEDLEHLTRHCMVVKGPLTAQRSVPEVLGEVKDACLRLLSKRDADAAGSRPVGLDDQLATVMSQMQRDKKFVWIDGQGGLGKTTMATQLQRDLEASGLVRHAAVLPLEFTAGSGPTLSDEAALRLLAGAVRDLEGRDCSSASPLEIRRLFAAAATRPGTLVVVDNVHSHEQLGLLLRGVRLDCVPFMAFTSRLREPIGGGAHCHDVWMQASHIGHQAPDHATTPTPQLPHRPRPNPTPPHRSRPLAPRLHPPPGPRPAAGPRPHHPH